MGKRNRLKHLIGRFNKETQSEITPLPYSINNVVREMHVKMDLNHDTSLAIANVPYYLKEDLLKELCTKALGMNVARVHFTISTSLHGDLKTGYRSGFLNFMTMQDRRCAFDACKVLEKPIDLDDVELKVPKWHKIMSLKRSHSAMNDSKTEEHEKADLIKPDDDHWVNVTKQHKSSFRGKINRIVPLNANMEKADTRIGDDKMDADVDEAPARKKKRRK